MSIWVAVLRVSDRTAQKITHKHLLNLDDIRDALIAQRNLPYRMDLHPERGLRAFVTLWTGTLQVVVVLYPAGDDEWHLGSAYRI